MYLLINISIYYFLLKDINLTDIVNLTNLTLKVILLITRDLLRINDLSIIKLVIIKSLF